MSQVNDFPMELADLFNKLCEGELGPDQTARLEQALRTDPALRRLYLRYTDLYVELRRRYSFEHVSDNTTSGQVAATDSHDANRSSQTFTSIGSPPVSAPQFFSDTLYSTVGYLSSGWPVAYLVATVVFGIGLLIGSFMPMSRSQQIAEQLRSPSRSSVAPAIESVGRITGLVDCQWADPTIKAIHGALVPLGHKYALASGTMEITYDTGAKVILQGPARYEVESTSGGFLSVGKLTARVEKRGERRGERGEGTPNLQTSKSPNASLSTLHSPLFIIKTPTATVTDLGTEFGVEVDQRGQTMSHVFHGSVKVQLVGAGAESQRDSIVLHENESVQTEKTAGGHGPQVTLRRVSADPRAFSRQLVEPPKFLDLLDIVAGGNGLGHRRERGIDPSTAMEDPLFTPGFRHVGRGYQRATTYRQNLLDGVFLSDGSPGAVQLDSAGHSFLGFPKAADAVWGSFWARAATVKPADRERAKNERRLVYCIDHDERFTPAGRGLLCLAPNMGLTFNIEAMRKAYPTTRPARFRAVAGVGDVSVARMPDEGRGDYWVFVDGQLKLKRMQIGPRDGVVQLDVELGSDDRFLTLVSTDSADEKGCGYVIFGDPVLELSRNQAEGR